MTLYAIQLVDKDDLVISFENLIWLFTSNEYSRGVVRLNIAEAALLYKYCRLQRDSTLLEIGRKHAGSTIIMASALEKGELFSIDIVLHDEALLNIRKSKLKNIHLITQNSVKTQWKKPIGLLFIDGDHSFRGVQSDVIKYSPFVVDKGYLLMHDVIGKKSELEPIVQRLCKSGWKKTNKADSLLVLQKR